jgi:hypothetical protein
MEAEQAATSAMIHKPETIIPLLRDHHDSLRER